MLVKYAEGWTLDKKNIMDISSGSAICQCYFKEDDRQ